MDKGLMEELKIKRTRDLIEMNIRESIVFRDIKKKYRGKYIRYLGEYTRELSGQYKNLIFKSVYEKYGMNDGENNLKIAKNEIISNISGVIISEKIICYEEAKAFVDNMYSLGRDDWEHSNPHLPVPSRMGGY